MLISPARIFLDLDYKSGQAEKERHFDILKSCLYRPDVFFNSMKRCHTPIETSLFLLEKKNNNHATFQPKYMSLEPKIR